MSRKTRITGRWYGLFDFADPNSVPNNPVMTSQSKDELRQRAKTEDRDWLITDLEYDPRNRVPIVPVYAPDADAQIQALRTVLDADGGES